MWRNDELPEPEIFTPERIAEFLLNNSMMDWEYRDNLLQVIEMGVDPLSIPQEYLDRSEKWQQVENYPDILALRKKH